jgi:hypothetical protein
MTYVEVKMHSPDEGMDQVDRTWQVLMEDRSCSQTMHALLLLKYLSWLYVLPFSTPEHPLSTLRWLLACS